MQVKEMHSSIGFCFRSCVRYCSDLNPSPASQLQTLTQFRLWKPSYMSLNLCSSFQKALSGIWKDCREGTERTTRHTNTDGAEGIYNKDLSHRPDWCMFNWLSLTRLSSKQIVSLLLLCILTNSNVCIWIWTNIDSECVCQIWQEHNEYTN